MAVSHCNHLPFYRDISQFVVYNPDYGSGMVVRIAFQRNLGKRDILILTTPKKLTIEAEIV